MIHILAISVGGRFLNFVRFWGGIGLLLRKATHELLNPPFYMRLLVEQIYQIGIRSMSLCFAAALCTGMVMALQFGFGLEKFGGKLYVPKIVSLSLTRELGPVFTSLMLAGRVGAGIASEIGSMVVTQQIDAIRALGTSPIKRIVIPRILATLISLPILTVMSNAIGTLGALIVCSTELGLDPSFFIQKVASTVTVLDYAAGMVKTIFFALFISGSACYFGMNVTEGTRGVGSATTKAVVASSILIVIGDFFITKLFWILFE